MIDMEARDKVLVGSLETGYRYVDSDTVTNAIIRKEIIGNTIENITKGKTKKKNMKTKDFYELARFSGVATLRTGHTEIPVRVTNIEHESSPFGNTTEITLETVHLNTAGRRNVKKVDDPIKNVYFNDPVTVVLWTDGSRTIVKAQNGELYDPEKGLAMAIAKKFMGDNETKSNYYNVFKKFLPKQKPRKDGVIRKSGPCPWEERDSFNPANRLGPVDDDRWHIWVTHLNPTTGETMGHAVYPHDYSTKYAAERAARRVFGTAGVHEKWVVSRTNPWTEEEK